MVDWIGQRDFILLAFSFYSWDAEDILNKNKKRAEDFRNIWEPLIIESLDEIPENFLKLKKDNELNFLILWNYLQELLLEDSKSNLLIFAKRVNLLSISRKFLEHNLISSINYWQSML